MPGARHIAPSSARYPVGVDNERMNPPKNSGKVIEISQPQDANARIEGFTRRLIESNEMLAAALVRLRDFYLAGAPPLVADKVLAQVDTALEMAKRTENGF